MPPHSKDPVDPGQPMSRRYRRGQRPPLDVNAIPGMSLGELRALWPIYMGRAKCPAQRRIVIRELAWRYQERLYGGLDAETKRLLNAAVRAAMKRRLPPIQTPGSANVETSTRLRRPPAPSPAQRTLSRVPVGSRLIRVWPEGSRTRHEVTILDGGKLFEYRGQPYKSLSEIARLITGVRWSGPRFFGLNSKRLSRGGEV